jgi:PAS domain S-box-containing protein
VTAATQPRTPRRPLSASVAPVVLVAAAYFTTGLLGQWLSPAESPIVPLWLPAGIALACMMLDARHLWTGLWAGAFCVALYIGIPAELSVLVATANVLAAGAGALLLVRVARVDPALSSRRDATLFGLLGAVATPIFSASLGMSILCWGGYASWQGFGNGWMRWWLGDAAGVIVAAPALLIWTRGERRRMSAAAMAEAGIIAGALVFSTIAAFAHPAAMPAYPLAFLPFPFVIWATLRFGAHGMSAAVVTTSLVSIFGSIVSPTGMVGTEGMARVGMLWLFNATIGSTALFLSAFLSDARSAMKSLAASENRLALALAGADDAVWDWDAVNNTIVFGERWAAMLGFTMEEIGPHHTAFLRLVHPDDRGRVLNALNAHLNAETSVYESEYRMRNKAGQWQWILDRARISARDDEGRPLRWTGTHKDISELKRAHEELERAHSELEERVEQRTAALAEANETLRLEMVAREEAEAALRRADRLASMGTLAAGIAHEINNPVGAILVAAELAEAEPTAPQRVRDSLRLIAREAKRCGQIVQSVLKFARQGTLEKHPCDLNATVRRALELVGSYARDRNVALDAALFPDLPLVMISEPEVEQIVVNLVQNAIQAQASTVRVTTAAGDGCVRLTVRDDGVGLDGVDLGRVFDPFYTTRASDGGTGLGLSIAHGLVEDHGGTIELSSLPTGGAIVVVELLLHADQADVQPDRPRE